MKSWLFFPCLIVLFAALIILPNCSAEAPKTDPYKIDKVDGLKTVQVEQPQAALSKRFSVESHGYFNGGYNGNAREIVIVTDSQTGKQYLCITGCGATELHTDKSGKTTVWKEE